MIKKIEKSIASDLHGDYKKTTLTDIEKRALYNIVSIKKYQKSVVHVRETSFELTFAVCHITVRRL